MYNLWRDPENLRIQLCRQDNGRDGPKPVETKTGTHEILDWVFLF